MPLKSYYIGDLDKAKVLQALTVSVINCPRAIDVSSVELKYFAQILQASDCSIGYFYARPLGVNLAGNYLRPAGYDHWNCPGAAEKICYFIFLTNVDFNPIFQNLSTLQSIL